MKGHRDNQFGCSFVPRQSLHGPQKTRKDFCVALIYIWSLIWTFGGYVCRPIYCLSQLYTKLHRVLDNKVTSTWSWSFQISWLARFPGKQCQHACMVFEKLVDTENRSFGRVYIISFLHSQLALGLPTSYISQIMSPYLVGTVRFYCKVIYQRKLTEQLVYTVVLVHLVSYLTNMIEEIYRITCVCFHLRSLCIYL